MADTGLIGIIGGSGFYNLPGFTDAHPVEIDTPFGKPSDPPIVGKLGGRDVVFIARHGKGHRYSPTNMPVRANIFALKMLGVTHVLSISAVGSMREEIEPLHMVVPSQLFDRTMLRPRTFFDEGPVVHISFADPYCPDLRDALIEAAEGVDAVVHRGGTYICIEGPQFSTRAESEIFRSWGVAVIGMTALPEARLAREAEMCYATLAMATDYDVWHPQHDDVTVEVVVRTLNANVQKAREVVAALIPTIADTRTCSCGDALASAIMTAPELLPDDVKDRLRPLIGRYIG